MFNLDGWTLIIGTFEDAVHQIPLYTW